MRMCILFGGAAMCSPARVADPVSAFDGRLLQNFFEFAQFSRRAAHFQLAVLRHNGDSRRVVSAVFQLAQPFNNDGHDFFRSDITDNSAHTAVSPGNTYPGEVNTEFLPPVAR